MEIIKFYFLFLQTSKKICKNLAAGKKPQWFVVFCKSFVIPLLFFSQFRFSNWLDKVLIFIGIVTGLLSGVALPGHMLLFGEVINQFVYYSIATETVVPRIRDFVNSSNNTKNETFEQIACDTDRANEALTGLAQNGTDVYLCTGDQGSSIFGEVVTFVCNPGDELQDNIAIFAYYYLAIAVGVLLATFLANALLNLTAYRQTRRMRLAFFRNVLRQEIGWFDVTDSAQLNTRLSE